jgi:hypothetical protein
MAKSINATQILNQQQLKNPAAFIAALNAALRRLQAEIEAGGGVFPAFANGRFHVRADGFLWFQLKDDATGLYYTPYIHNGVLVIEKAGEA